MFDIFVILFLILLNSLFAMAEIALVSSKKIRLQSMADNGDKGAIKALHLQQNPGYFLSSIQVGITSIAILSGIVGEKSFVEPTIIFLNNLGLPNNISPTVGNMLVIFILTTISVIFGEIIPKSIALNLSDKIAAIISRPMDLFTKLFFPFIWFFDSTSSLFLKIFKLNKFETPPITNEEIKELMGQGAEAGVFHESEKKLVANVLHMDEKQVTTIMTHRTEWKFIDLNDEFDLNIEKLIENKKSKVLAVEGSTDSILGVVHITDIMELIYKSINFNIKDFVKIPLYLPFTVTVSQVLESFKNNHNEIAIIINEYGENIGIVTSSDILQALVGNIEDKDYEEDRDISIRDDGTYLIDGTVTLDKIYDFFDIPKFSLFHGVHTLGGYVMATAGCVPKINYKTETNTSKYSIEIEVVDMDGNCVDKLLFKITKLAENEEQKP